MATTKHHLLGPIVLIMIATGCTVERQAYIAGPEIEWHRKAPVQIDERSATMDDDGDIQTPHGIDAIKDEELPAELSLVEVVSSSAQQTVHHDPIIPPYSRRGFSAVTSPSVEPSITPVDPQPVLSPDGEEASSEGNKGLVTGGWILAALGFVLLLFVSILLGLLLMIGGIAMIAAGSPKKGSSKSQKKEKESSGEWQDVVYLQNGSVIRGMLIEQIPNVSLKIQTSDGSVFVYEMKEVLKITKEQKP